MVSGQRFSRMFLLLAVCAMLAACGKSGGDAKPATQVAAKVNDDEITVHQINQALARAGQLSAEQAKVAGQRSLEQLVDQQLLVQQATAAKLDRNPDVMVALDAARRQVLAQAYMERSVTAAAAKPDASEIRQFYDARPELFAERRIYRLQEVAANVGPEKLPALAELIGKTKNLNDILAFLRSNDIKFSSNPVVRPAEQMPQDALPMLAKLKDGDIVGLRSNGRFTIVQRTAAPLAPLGMQEATPYIEQFLANRKRNELAGAELKRLRQMAKLEYLGDFARQTGAGPAAAAPASAVATGAVAPASTMTAPAASGATAAARDSAKERAFEAGLKALK